MTNEQKQKLDKAIDMMATDKDVLAFIKETEASVKTTQNHYGKYMSFLTHYAKDKVILHIVSEGLKRAGANIQGVNSALMVLKGGV